ncbi:glutamine synthetase family protein [Mycobacterium sp. GA-2829]|uniref:glutamine synthetase family protein n=1 Tax=Mycobacterium sp. GA-2829 TaxID=1772283 RepID=UPI001E4447D3|nr:glutamine synthetase family protein [Mycobacterium sp. GA-2829]
MDAVIAELTDADGTPLDLSPRVAVQSLAAKYDELNLQPVLGFEYELWLFQNGPQGRIPLGRTENAYSLTRGAEIHDLTMEFVSRMDQVGIEVEMVHGELGPGFFEFTLAPRPALQAADAAVRARQYLRDLCAERGLHASFMAKPYADKSGAGGHVHSSLTRDGVNIFAEPGRKLSETGEHYLAGLVSTMPDVTLLLNPYINSYKRIDPEMFTPCAATWGDDDRSTACRLILGDPRSSRVEHRRPGADANPYLVAAALLAGGLRGLSERATLPVAGTEPAALPGDLKGALAHFESALWLTDLLGKNFCASFAATRRAELARYETWLKTTITEWETARHLEQQ